MPPAGESGQTAEGMHTKASVEKDLTKCRMPEGHEPRPRSFLCLQGNQTEGVVGKMHRHVDSDDDATNGTEPGETSRRDQSEGNVSLKKRRKTER